jgi:hypothetical protein
VPEDKKFKFVNDINAVESSIIDDKFEEVELTQEEINQRTIETLLKEKKMKQIRFTRIVLGMTVLTIILFILSMLWQGSWTLMTVSDGLWLVFALEFFMGWVLFVYNHNIFSPVIYGLKSFALMFVGKRPKTDYYSYMKNIQDNQIPGYFYYMFFVAAFFVLIPALITLFILL